ncbi:MAG TPA: aspartyl protease family protein [Gemmataceae bacterium]|jgi:predicted aspartyl protease|nr:aspartyl protease family protein [Gemmataceae bacterium]
MGHFHIDCQVINIRRSLKRVKVSNLLVDTGSEFTWVPEDLLMQAGIRVEKKDVPFQMANGQIITRSTGYAIFKTPQFETVDEVVFGQTGDLRLLGARTLEGFGALIDARHKRLVAAGPNPAATLGTRAWMTQTPDRR